MRSWEYSKNIIAFFKSFPDIETRTCSFFTTVVAQNYQLFSSLHSSYDNPEIKSDPYEIVEELVQLIEVLHRTQISIDLVSNLDLFTTPRHQVIYQDYIVPMISALASHTIIGQFRELDIDLFTLQGLFDDRNRSIIPDVVNTIVYV